ncbi:MAG: AAA family ATPase, partial [Chloroflexi bacterium]|nr:AAA family ATPase [Chloroflexota bacterium]
LQDMNPFNARLKSDKDLELTVRIGIHTGLVVAGEMGGGDTLEELAIVGETPNIAARIEGAAEPNRVAISDVTANFVQGFFICETMGPHELKGISEPVELFRVLEESGAQTRFDVAATTQLTPLVGRQQEVGLLKDRWEQVEEGLGQVVLISGEAGIGKSRLLQGIYDNLEERPHWLLAHRCSPYHQNSPLFPIIESLGRWLGFRTEDSSGERLQMLEERLRDYSVQINESVPLFAGLLSVPLDDRYPDLNLSPQRQRQKTMELLVQLLVEESAERPVLAVYEDLHWADPTTLEFLGLLVDQVATSKVMVIFTFRPEFTPPWGSRSHVTQITLNRLPQRLATDLIGRVASGKELPEEVVTQIASKSDGVPLFVEELTKMVLESGLLHEVDGRYELSGPLTALAIPSTLQDSLTARLDRLGEVKEVVQLASVLGREFIYQLIQAVSQQDDASLSDHLRQLVTGEFLYQQGMAPEASYIFKHALIQDAAYNSLLISRRQQYHQLVAQVYEESFPETVEAQPELVAHHYTEAGLNLQAVDYWQKAGRIAMGRSAIVEAFNHLSQGLALLEELPDSPKWATQELAIQTMLGHCLIQIKGYSSPEVLQRFQRAQELIAQIGDNSQYPQVMFGVITYYMIRAEYRSSEELATQFIEAAERSQEPFVLPLAHMLMGTGLYYTGEIVRAHDHLLQGITHYELDLHRTLALSFIQEPTSTGLCFSARVLWLLGYPSQSTESVQAAITLAQDVAHPFTLGFVYAFAAVHHINIRSIESALSYTDAVIDVGQQQSFPVWRLFGSIFQGACWAQMGRTQESIASLKQGLAAIASAGTLISQSQYLWWLAQAHLIAGEANEGLEVLDRAFTHVDDTGERFWKAELHRLKGELLLLPRGSEEEAEVCFNQALKVARSQSAKSLELRAAMSLSRLWQKQDKSAAARGLLAGVYGWFTEGFETPDLIDAKALLEELEQLI